MEQQQKPLCMFTGRCRHFNSNGTCDKQGHCEWQSKTREDDRRWADYYLDDNNPLFEDGTY